MADMNKVRQTYDAFVKQGSAAATALSNKNFSKVEEGSARHITVTSDLSWNGWLSLTLFELRYNMSIRQNFIAAVKALSGVYRAGAG